MVKYGDFWMFLALPVIFQLLLYGICQESSDLESLLGKSGDLKRRLVLFDGQCRPLEALRRAKGGAKLVPSASKEPSSYPFHIFLSLLNWDLSFKGFDMF